jgi:hypothetical protein
MSTLSDRICEERDCMTPAGVPVVVEAAGGVEYSFALCNHHASKIESGVDFMVEKQAGERPVIVIDQATDR